MICLVCFNSYFTSTSFSNYIRFLVTYFFLGFEPFKKKLSLDFFSFREEKLQKAECQYCHLKILQKGRKTPKSRTTTSKMNHSQSRQSKVFKECEGKKKVLQKNKVLQTHSH